ncbi:MAG: hypothetical protein WC222_09780 [Parachlamydiales bacterium]|jgi:hypothetical protein
MSHHGPFYGHDIIRGDEQEYVKKLLKKYENEPINDDLKKKVWEELMEEKSLGHITIPFKLALRRDATGKFPPYLEIILDTKV